MTLFYRLYLCVAYLDGPPRVPSRKHSPQDILRGDTVGGGNGSGSLGQAETCLEDAIDEQQEPWSDMVEANVTAGAVMEATAAEAVSEAESVNATEVVTVAAAKSIAQTEVYRWLIKRKAYEARLEDECRRKNIQFREHVTSYVACFSDKQLLRSMMSIWKIRGEPEDMLE
ncbi:hypothetical protein H257_19065 [Aphanomyces astaci]|uniref:Uncharacterized protein n=1 Tax=Aphanomyces astaci TaxID=112090 RepID=W4F968_APHAT|nr:hypothetical protein H257_19065 [Aphanomyces astaci]ETV63997.1 hypothetical protein H257_19065 [Aphanomyces astaci]|eukprot:XP_009846516.1 hypothetical protein H257_19065 [Aphanomyces astaci]